MTGRKEKNRLGGVAWAGGLQLAIPSSARTVRRIDDPSPHRPGSVHGRREMLDADEL